MTDERFYIRTRGRITGPYGPDQLRGLVSQGRFTRQHQVSRDKVAWQPASELTEFFRTVSARPNDQVPASPEDRLFAPPSTPIGDDLPTETYVPTESDRLDAGYGMNSSSGPSEWYFAHNGQQFGPVSLAYLQSKAATGGLLAEDLVWSDGMISWSEAAQVPGLFELSIDHGLESPGEILLENKTSGLALFSFVLGLLGTNVLLGVGSLASVISGHLALRELQQQPDRLTGRWLAITGLVFGYLGIIAAIIVLATILLVR